MDKIIIHDLEIRMRVGTIDAERNWPQKLLLTLEIEYNMHRAIKTDDLQYALDYEKIAVRLKEWGETRQWKLLERMASDIADLILLEFYPVSVSVMLKKFELPMCTGVSVQIKERRDPLRKNLLEIIS